MTIGRLAWRTGLSVRTLRFYADAGVLPDAGRAGEHTRPPHRPLAACRARPSERRRLVTGRRWRPRAAAHRRPRRDPSHGGSPFSGRRVARRRGVQRRHRCWRAARSRVKHPSSQPTLSVQLPGETAPGQGRVVGARRSAREPRARNECSGLGIEPASSGSDDHERTVSGPQENPAVVELRLLRGEVGTVGLRCASGPPGSTVRPLVQKLPANDGSEHCAVE